MANSATNLPLHARSYTIYLSILTLTIGLHSMFSTLGDI